MKPQAQPDPDRRDVVVYEIETRKVVTLAGLNMSSEGFYNYQKHIETASERCNEHYSAKAVPVNKYKVGDIIAESDMG